MNLIKRGSLIAVPSCFLYYFLKDNVKSGVNAKEIEKKVLKAPNSVGKSSDSLESLAYLKRSKNESRSLIEAYRVKNNVPGMTCAVSYQGKELWSFGQGLADIETRAPMTDDSVMRIGSITKTMTVFFLGKLLEAGKLDLDKPISHYLDKEKWPEKKFDNEKVDITLRQLISHLGGVRHFNPPDAKLLDYTEIYLNEQFDDVNDALNLFKNDDLVCKPGTKWYYSTYGFVLASAVIQSVLEKDKKFETELIKLLRNELRMTDTYLDVNETIIPNRVKYYEQKKINDPSKRLPSRGELINVRELNNSNKWAAAGLLSNVHDLLKFGNAMMYSYKTNEGVLKQETMRTFCTPNQITWRDSLKSLPFEFAMPWKVFDEKPLKKYKSLEPNSLCPFFCHLGYAVGSSSVLIVFPEEEIVIAIMGNLKYLFDIGHLSIDIAKCVLDNLKDVNEIS